MQLVIAEKPDMGRQIADVLGCTSRRDGWREGGDWCVTWCFGHMVEIYAEEDKGGWSAERLPLLPERFLLRPIRDEGAKGTNTIERQLQTIRGLMVRCQGIVVATDAGREGELIFRNLYEYLGIRRPFRRLWLNALEPEAIAEAFEDLRPGSEFDNLAAAAKQREIADWLVGVNATRALTLAVGKRGEPLSLGRVQTPTLRLICERYIEHKRFRSVPYWYLQGSSTKDGVTFIWRSAERYDRRQDAERDMQAVLRGGTVAVEDVATERRTENPPLLHDLASLQKEANARYRFPMEYTLELAQSLYMKHLLTYPRTESRYIPEVVFEKMPARLSRHAGDPQYGALARELAAGGLCRRSVNDAKVKDHHALLVTDTAPREMEEDERKVYGLVLARMLEAFSPVCVADVTKVTFAAAGVRFSARCRKNVSPGWRAVMRGDGAGDVQLDEVDEIEMSMRPLPAMAPGERLAVDGLEMVEDQTRPKPLYSDATLLTAMENAGAASDSKEVAEALRDVGIGTPATRHEIKKVLIRRKYIEVKNGRLLPTKLGMHVYVAVRDKSISSVDLTARWETALAQIADGARDAAPFGQSIRKYTARVTADLLHGGEEFGRLREFVAEGALFCPRCRGRRPSRASEMLLGTKSAYCPACKLTVWREVAGKRLGDETMTALLNNGMTSLLTGFRSKGGNAFDAYVRLEMVDEPAGGEGTEGEGGAARTVTVPSGRTFLEFPKRETNNKR